MIETENLLSRAKDSKELVKELRELAQKSLFFLTKAILGFDSLNSTLHKDVCNVVQSIDKYPFLLVLLPRKHFKSTIATVSFPIWIHIQDFIPSLGLKGCDVRILIANESATNAEHFLSIIEGLWERNELLRLLFPELIPDPPRKRWNAQEMLLNREAIYPEASIETIGVGGAAQSRHYDIRILDDLIGEDAMNSQVVMEKAINWFDYSESLSVSPQRSICRVLGTRWSKQDLYEHIMEKDKKFFVYTRQYAENGKPIFPEWYTMEYFDELRAKNAYHFNSQYCNSPTDPSRCDFKEEWLKLYTWEHSGDKLLLHPEDDKDSIDLRELDIVGAFDPSIDEKPQSSRRAIVYIGADHKQRIYLLDVYASRDTINVVMDNLFRLYRKWTPRIFAVESVALSRVFIPLIEAESKLRKQWISCTPVTVPTHKSKDARIRDTLQQVAAQGRLYRLSHMREFDQEFIEFPQSKTKDILDALSHCIHVLRVPDSFEEEENIGVLEEIELNKRNPITGY